MPVPPRLPRGMVFLPFFQVHCTDTSQPGQPLQLLWSQPAHKIVPLGAHVSIPPTASTPCVYPLLRPWLTGNVVLAPAPCCLAGHSSSTSPSRNALSYFVPPIMQPHSLCPCPLFVLLHLLLGRFLALSHPCGPCTFSPIGSSQTFLGLL